MKVTIEATPQELAELLQAVCGNRTFLPNNLPRKFFRLHYEYCSPPRFLNPIDSLFFYLLISISTDHLLIREGYLKDDFNGITKVL